MTAPTTTGFGMTPAALGGIPVAAPIDANGRIPEGDGTNIYRSTYTHGTYTGFSSQRLNLRYNTLAEQAERLPDISDPIVRAFNVITNALSRAIDSLRQLIGLGRSAPGLPEPPQEEPPEEPRKDKKGSEGPATFETAETPAGASDEPPALPVMARAARQIEPTTADEDTPPPLPVATPPVTPTDPSWLARRGRRRELAEYGIQIPADGKELIAALGEPHSLHLYGIVLVGGGRYFELRVRSAGKGDLLNLHHESLVEKGFLSLTYESKDGKKRSEGNLRAVVSVKPDNRFTTTRIEPLLKDMLPPEVVVDKH